HAREANMPQSRKKRPNKPEPLLKSRQARHGRSVTFQLPRGREVEVIELTADSGYHSVTIRFKDNTDLEVIIDPALVFKAELYDWKGGKHRVLRRWPTVYSQGS